MDTDPKPDTSVTANTDSWIRRFVGGRRRDEDDGEKSEQEATTAALPPAADDLEARMQLLAEQNAILVQANTRKDRRIRELDALAEQTARQDLTPRVRELTAELQAQQRSLLEAQSVAEQASVQAHALGQELTRFKQEAAVQRKRADRVVANHAGLQAQLGPLREQLRRAQKQQLALQEKLELEGEHRARVESGLKHAAARVSGLKRQLAAAETELTAQRNDNHRRQAELDALQDLVVELRARTEEADERVEAADALRRHTIEHLFGPASAALVAELVGHTKPTGESSS